MELDDSERALRVSALADALMVRAADGGSDRADALVALCVAAGRAAGAADAPFAAAVGTFSRQYEIAREAAASMEWAEALVYEAEGAEDAVVTGPAPFGGFIQ